MRTALTFLFWTISIDLISIQLGGKTFEEYGFGFTEQLKEHIRKRDGYICQICSKTQKQNNRSLDVHHIDYDKKNCLEGNLISLCISCHIKTNYNRKKWTKYFKDFLVFSY